MADKRVLKYFDYIPKEFRDYTIVAGGAAVDFDKATDVDLWVILPQVKPGLPQSASKGYETSKIQNEFSYHLHTLGLIPNDSMAIQLDGVFERKILGEQSESYMNDDQVEIAFNVWPTGMKKAQIMFTTHRSIMELIKSFDITSHAKAITVDGIEFFTSQYTTPEERPRLVTASAIGGGTPARLVRIAARYGFEVTPEEAVAEAQAINPAIKWEILATGNSDMGYKMIGVRA